MRTLIAPGALLKSTWETFVKTWNVMVAYSAWYLLTGVLAAASLFVPPENIGLNMALLLANVANVIVVVWATACMYQIALANEMGAKTVTEQVNKRAQALIPSFIWIGFLNALAFLGPALLLLLFAFAVALFLGLETTSLYVLYALASLPAIYIAVRLGFGTIFLVDKGMKGRAALASSWNLTNDRFWEILLRQFLGGLIFVGGVVVVTIVIMIIIGIVAGETKLDLLMAASDQDPLKQGIMSMIQSIIQAATVSLMLIFQAKLYRSLIQTNE